MYDRILVGVDNSTEGESILGRVGVLAAKHNAEVVLLMVLPVPPVVVADGKLIATIDQEMERMRAVAWPYLAKWKDRFELSGVKASATVRFGDPAEQIASYSREHKADLIVVPQRARKGLGRLRRSVGEKVVQLAVAPVLLINTPQAA